MGRNKISSHTANLSDTKTAEPSPSKVTWAPTPSVRSLCCLPSATLLIGTAHSTLHTLPIPVHAPTCQRRHSDQMLLSSCLLRSPYPTVLPEKQAFQRHHCPSLSLVGTHTMPFFSLNTEKRNNGPASNLYFPWARGQKSQVKGGTALRDHLDGRALRSAWEMLARNESAGEPV